MDNDWVSPFNGKEGPDFIPPHRHSDWRVTAFNFGVLGFIGYLLLATSALAKDARLLTTSHNILNDNVNSISTISNKNDLILEEALRDHNNDPYSHGRY